tara:strand:- start:4152 stop:5429 length:1278 start_codon:yes stop_codon:yes gene_type:complete
MSLHPQQTSVIPNRIFYKLPTTTDYQSRQMTKILPANGSGDFKENSQITIELPANGFADFKNSALSLKAKLTNAAGADKIVFDNSSCPFIKRVRIADGWNNTIEDITNYADVVAVNEKLFHSVDYVNGVGTILEGITTQGSEEDAARVKYSEAANKRSLSLVSGVLQSTQLWPLEYSRGLIIEIFLSTAAEAGGKASATGASELVVSNVSFNLETIQVSPVYKQAFEQKLVTSGIKFNCPTWLTTKHTTNGSSHFSSQLSENMKSIKHIFFYCRDSANENVTTKRQTEIFQSKGAVDYQFRWGNRYVPNQRVDCDGTSAEALVELLKAMNVSNDVTISNEITLDSFSNIATNEGGPGVGASSKAIYGQNFELDADENMSGLSSIKQPLSLEINFASGATITTNVYTMINYDQILVITPQGVMSSY